MILLIDVGNTRLKWQVRHAQARHEDAPLAQGREITADFSAEGFAKAFPWETWPCTRVVVSSVASAMLGQSLQTRFALRGLPCLWLLPPAQGFGIVNAYEPPHALGPDRFAALVAVQRLGLGPCVVVSVGTALTADMLTAQGCFLGGAIAPGPTLMRTALAQGTARVASVAWAVAPQTPVDTGSAVGQGIALALRGVVEGMHDRMREALGATQNARPVTVLTGGARAVLRPFLSGEVHEVEDLVLDGLAWIAKEWAC